MTDALLAQYMQALEDLESARRKVKLAEEALTRVAREILAQREAPQKKILRGDRVEIWTAAGVYYGSLAQDEAVKGSTGAFTIITHNSGHPRRVKGEIHPEKPETQKAEPQKMILRGTRVTVYERSRTVRGWLAQDRAVEGSTGGFTVEAMNGSVLELAAGRIEAGWKE